MYVCPNHNILYYSFEKYPFDGLIIIWIGCGLAYRHHAVCTGVLRTIRMNANKRICIIFIRNLCTFRITDIDIVRFPAHDMTSYPRPTSSSRSFNATDKFSSYSGSPVLTPAVPPDTFILVSVAPNPTPQHSYLRSYQIS